jgi:hypothetical protein
MLRGRCHLPPATAPQGGRLGRGTPRRGTHRTRQRQHHAAEALDTRFEIYQAYLDEELDPENADAVRASQ